MHSHLGSYGPVLDYHLFVRQFYRYKIVGIHVDRTVYCESVILHFTAFDYRPTSVPTFVCFFALDHRNFHFIRNSRR